MCVQERRKAAVTELVRLLKLGGRALIYVWAMEQEYKNQKSYYLKHTKNQEKQHNQHENKANLQNQNENLQNQLEDEASSQENQEHVEPETVKESPDHVASTITKPSGNVSSEQDSGNLSPPKLSVHINRTAFESQDLLVPWHLKGEAKKSCETSVFHRFYHVFQQGELEALCQSVGGVKVQQSYYDQGNWCVILQKVHQ